MTTTLRTLALLAALLCASTGWAVGVVVRFPYATGQTFRWYPQTQAISGPNWTTYAATVTESPTGMYTATLDTTIATDWVLFASASQPASFAAYVDSLDLLAVNADDMLGDIHESTESTGVEVAAGEITAIVNAVWGAARSSYVASGTMGQFVNWLQATLGSSGVFTQPALAEAPSGGSTEADTRDFDEVEHVFVLARTSSGANVALESTPDTTLYMHRGDERRVGFDCNIPALLPNGTVLSQMEDPPTVTGDDGDVEVEKSGIGPNGLRQPMLAKLHVIVAEDAELGTYTITARVKNRLGTGWKPVRGKLVVLE